MNKTDKELKELTGVNTRLLSFKYLGPTDFKGSRVKITDKRFKKSKTIPYDHCYNNAGAVAARYLLNNGWDVVGSNEDYGILIIGTWDCGQQL